jgi:hypothetical protein
MYISATTRVIAFLLSATVSFPSLSECPPGKAPITLQTPSGKIKTLCVPDKAVQGIENASDNSAGTILPATCPAECWSAEELSILDTKYEGGITCKLEDPNVQFCSTFDTSELLSLQYIDYLDLFVCYSATGTKTVLGTREEAIYEAEACVALLEPYSND